MIIKTFFAIVLEKSEKEGEDFQPFYDYNDDGEKVELFEGMKIAIGTFLTDLRDWTSIKDEPRKAFFATCLKGFD